MTRKHLEAIAATFRNARPPITTNEWHTWAALCVRFAKVAEGFNPQFDERKFLLACGLEAARVLDKR